jgi:starch synthase
MLGAEALIFISEADRRSWIGDNAANVICNFVDLERFRPDLEVDSVRADFGIGRDQPLILYLGGLSRAKGVFPLLEALAQIVRTVPRVCCLMPGLDASAGQQPTRGTGALRRSLHLRTEYARFNDRVRDFGLADVVVTAPFAPDIAPLIGTSDVVVFPATRPHFARPVIEAAAMAKPVVASRFAVMEELVESGITGLLVPPDDPEELAAALTSVLRDCALARRLGNAGRQVATERFDMARQIGRITDVYERVLATR